MSTKSDPETDHRIMAAVQRGDRSAFGELYDRNNGWMMALALRILQDRRNAEDLLHDVFVEIWQQAPSYNPERGSVCSWLAVKTRSRAMDRLRALGTIKKRTSEQPVTELEFEDSAKSTDRDVTRSQALEMMNLLSPVQRTIIELSYFRGYSASEIADYCHIPLGTVKSGLLRGIRELRKYVKPCETPDS